MFAAIQGKKDCVKQLSQGKGIKTASLVWSANLCHYQYGALSLTSNAGNTAQKYTRPTAPELMSLAPAIMITYTAERKACQQSTASCPCLLKDRTVAPELLRSPSNQNATVSAPNFIRVLTYCGNNFDHMHGLDHADTCLQVPCSGRALAPTNVP